jgi:hypothetical protein
VSATASAIESVNPADSPAYVAKRYRGDPVGYVRDILGAEPEPWQHDVLVALGEHNRIAVASGHGIGKTALTAWIIHWFMATHAHPQVVVTANTMAQLTSKTWRELAKWNQRALNGEWFIWTAMRFYLKGAESTWFAAALPSTEQRSEAFAGAHEDNILILYDEASAIPDTIWEVTEGAMTTHGARWCVFGNPTRNTGRFRECFGRYRHRWFTLQVDSREVSLTDKDQLQAWIDDYGEDSDFVRVRVRGVFPRAASTQFIGEDIVTGAMTRPTPPDGPTLLGVDVARYGDDRSVICIRAGRNARSVAWRVFRELDTMAMADKVIEAIDLYDPRTVFIDGVGVGGGVVDRLRQLGFGRMIIEANAGERPSEPDKYVNRRAEMWAQMREWLATGALPEDPALREDLCNIEYGYDHNGRLKLERKEDMKKRGLASPDLADALALTFFAPVFDGPTAARHIRVQRTLGDDNGRRTGM